MEFDNQENTNGKTPRLVSIDEFIEGRKKFRRSQVQALLDAHAQAQANDTAQPPAPGWLLKSRYPFSLSEWVADDLRKRDQSLARFAAHLSLTVMIPIERIENTANNAFAFLSKEGKLLAVVDGFLPAIAWVNAYGESTLILDTSAKFSKLDHHTLRL